MSTGILLQQAPATAATVDGDTAFQNAEVLRDPEHLLDRLRQGPGTQWVAITADVADRARIVAQIADADPKVSVFLLGTSRGDSADLLKKLDNGQALQAAERRARDAEKLASITSLTSRIAHDIGTPMTAILGYAELLAKSAESDKNRKRAATIVEQVRRVSDRIATLMNLTRSKDQAPLPLALSGVVDQALDFFREKFERYGIDVERDEGSTPRVLADPGRLHLALLHLLYRAVEAMPDGGTLRLALGSNGSGDAELCIADSGAPIDGELRHSLLEPGGPELGLAVSKDLIEAHRGTLEVLPEPGPGTVFRLSLPAMGKGTT